MGKKDNSKKLRIVKFPDPILSQKCEEVTSFDVKIHKILDEMAELMMKNNGIGLAANQVGINKRMFIMIDSRGKVVEFINPEITDKDGSSNELEGCLSLDNFFIKCNRAETVTVKAQDRHGAFFTVYAYGIESVCIQHECDHLDGVFFISKRKE